MSTKLHTVLPGLKEFKVQMKVHPRFEWTMKGTMKFYRQLYIVTRNISPDYFQSEKLLSRFYLAV